MRARARCGCMAWVRLRPCAMPCARCAGPVCGRVEKIFNNTVRQDSTLQGSDAITPDGVFPRRTLEPMHGT